MSIFCSDFHLCIRYSWICFEGGNLTVSYSHLVGIWLVGICWVNMMIIIIIIIMVMISLMIMMNEGKWGHSPGTKRFDFLKIIEGWNIMTTNGWVVQKHCYIRRCEFLGCSLIGLSDWQRSSSKMLQVWSDISNWRSTRTCDREWLLHKAVLSFGCQLFF